MTPADFAALSGAVGAISPLGFALIAVFALFRGWVMTAAAHAAIMADRDRWIADITAQRNEWQDIAEGSTERLERLTTAIETLAKVQVPR